MPERENVMDEQMMIMEELKQVAGGNMFSDAWNWICDQMDRYQSHDWPEAECDGNC